MTVGVHSQRCCDSVAGNTAAPYHPAESPHAATLLGKRAKHLDGLYPFVAFRLGI